MNSPLLDALARHDAALRRAQPSATFDRRMRELIRRPAGTPRIWTPLVAAALALLVLGSVYGLLRRGPGFEGPASSRPVAGLISPEMIDGAGACQRDFEEARIDLRGRCTVELEASGVTIRTWTRAQIEARSDGLIVREGLVMIDVEPVPAGHAPVRVGVTGGSIEVLGTRFVIYEGVVGGEVELLEGKIRLAREDGQVQELQPGDRARWSRPTRTPEETEETPVVEPDVESADAPEPAPEPTPRRGERPPPEPSVSQDALNHTLVEVARLREGGRYRQALAQLRQLRRTTELPRRLAEVVSFEEGSLLEAAGSTDQACAHWIDHRRRFRKGRYRTEVSRHLEALGCDTN